MKQDRKAGELLRSYLRWPLVLGLFFAASAAAMFFISRRAGAVMSLIAAAAIIYILHIYLSSKERITRAMVGYAMSADQTRSSLSEDIDLPCGMVDAQGNFSWRNRPLFALTEGDRAAAASINGMLPDLRLYDLDRIEGSVDYSVQYRDRRYRMRVTATHVQDDPAYAVCFYDETDYLKLKEENDNGRMVAGLIYMDNYEEAMESVDEVRRSLLLALIDRKIVQYLDSLHGIVKKLEKDKYFFVIDRRALNEMRADRFDILEQVKAVSIGNEMRITLSIGIGEGGESYAQNHEFARVSMDMALGRGGDQAVVKNHDVVQYYGGKSQTVEKTTRVKARVKAHAFRELLESRDRLIIMGHKLADIDCLGAAIGLWRIAVTMNKKANIVMTSVNSSLKPMMNRFRTGEYPEDLFITEEQALAVMDEGTILVVVDVNRPGITEAPSLLEAAGTIVVLDHHRQAQDVIGNAVLSYIETYASSACEMVAEIVQYISEDVRIRAAEADAMYAGIVVDTHNFMNQTGVRTFEAAAFLRRNGADVTRVRKLFRERLEDTRAKAEAVHSAEIYRDAFAISVCPAEGLENPTVIGAQAANDLLDIVGVKASIVISNYNGIIYLSARSIDEVNVQVMMEKLGGGGHRTIAGAQLKGITEDEARRRIMEVIDDMSEKGEIS